MAKTRSGGDKKKDKDGDNVKGKGTKRGQKSKGKEKAKKKKTEAQILASVEMKVTAMDRITPEQKAAFINLMKNDFLWLIDVKNRRYKLTKEKPAAWDTIAGQINELGETVDTTDFTGDEMQALYINIRDQWNRLQKEQKQPGEVTTEKHQWLLDNCEFLSKYGRKKRAASSCPGSQAAADSISPGSQAVAASNSPGSQTGAQDPQLAPPTLKELMLCDLRASVEQVVSEKLAEREKDEKSMFAQYMLGESRVMTEENWPQFKEEVTTLMLKYRDLQRPSSSHSAPPQLYSPDGDYPVYLVRPNELQQLGPLPLNLRTNDDDDVQQTLDESTMESRDTMDTPNLVPTGPSLIDPVTPVDEAEKEKEDEKENDK